MSTLEKPAVGSILNSGSPEPPEGTILLWSNSGNINVEIYDPKWPLGATTWQGSVERCGPFVVGPDYFSIMEGQQTAGRLVVDFPADLPAGSYLSTLRRQRDGKYIAHFICADREFTRTVSVRYEQDR